MSKANWYKTDKTGVYYRLVKSLDGTNRQEREYYVRYKFLGTQHEVTERVGRASEGMTVAKAAHARAERITRKEPTNRERREQERIKSLYDGDKLTLRTLWKLYDRDRENRSTRKFDEKTLLPKLESIMDIEPESLTNEHIITLRKQLEAMPSKAAWLKDTNARLSPQSVKHVLGLLKRIMRYGVKCGLIAIPRGLEIEMPLVDNVKTETMTQEQLTAYLMAIDAMEDIHAKVYLKLLLLTGMRKTAALCLKWDDLDFEHDLITLRGTKRDETGAYTRQAKSGRTNTIPMHPLAKDLLLALPRESEWVFPSPKDPAKHREDFKKASTEARDAAGLPKSFRRSHGLRHEAASIMVQSGIPLFDVSKMLTHSNPAMTNRYAHLQPEHLRRAADALGSVIASATDKTKKD